MRFNNIRDNISKSNCSSENSQNSKTLLKDNINYQNKEKGSKLVEDFTDVFDNDNPEERFKELKQYIKKQEQEDSLFLIYKLAVSDEGNFYDDYENTGLCSWERDEILDSLKPSIVDTLKEYEGKIRDHLLFNGGTFANLDENLIYEIHRYITYISDHIDGDDPEIYKDLYDEITYKNMYRILEEISCLSLDEILNYIGDVPTYDKPDWVGPMFILPDGKFIYVQEVCGKNSIHSSFIEKIIENYIKENYPTAKINVDLKDYALDFMGELLDLGLVRCNTGSTASDRRFYCVIPSSDFARPTTRQYYGLLDYLDLAKDYVMVYGGDDDYQKYYMSDNTPDDILKKIKRYYTSGTLYEKLEIIDDIYTGNTNHNVKKSNIYADIYYDRHERMYTVCLKDKSNGDILSDNQWVFNKQEANTVKQDMLENPQSFIYDYYEIIDESLSESQQDKVEKVIKSKNYEQMSDIEMISYIYNGELRSGVHYDNYKHNKGDKVLVYDAWVNAKDKYSALNKLRRKLGFETLSNDELDSDIEDRYCIVEESNYYDKEHNVTYKWYVSYEDVELPWLKEEFLNEMYDERKTNKSPFDLTEKEFAFIIGEASGLCESKGMLCDIIWERLEYFLNSKDFNVNYQTGVFRYNGKKLFKIDYAKEDYRVWGIYEVFTYNNPNLKSSYMGGELVDIQETFNYQFNDINKLNESLLTEVYPHKGESKKDFTKRFMKVTKDEYPDVKQRYAVCMSYWSRRNKKRKNESLNEDYSIKQIFNKLLTLSMEDILKVVDRKEYDKPDLVGPMFLLKNGNFIYVEDYNETHTTFIQDLIEEYVYKTLPREEAGEIMDSWYEDDFIDDTYSIFDSLTQKGLISCNTSSIYESRVYIALPNRNNMTPTSSQYTGILEFLDLTTNEVEVCCSGGCKTYKDFIPEDVFKNIKRYYASGALYESLNEKLLKGAGLDIFYTDSPYQVKQYLKSKDTPQRIYINENQDTYLIGGANDCIHRDMIRLARHEGYLDSNLSINDYFDKGICLLYYPANCQDELQESSYGNVYTYKDNSRIYSRFNIKNNLIETNYDDFEDYELYKVLGKCEHTKIQ